MSKPNNARSKGKKGKVFLEGRDAMLLLAASVTTQKDEATQNKLARSAHMKEPKPTAPRKPKVSSKLQEVKATLVRKEQEKRHHKKQLKKKSTLSKNLSPHAKNASSTTQASAKRVTFE